MDRIYGLTDEQVKKSRKEWGTNKLTPKNQKTFSDVYWDNYKDPIIKVLLVALSINVIFTFFGKVDWYECLGILLSVLISTFVSSISEYSNENTFRKLQDEASESYAKVWRNGKLMEIKISEIVMGDSILLQSGDIVPADGTVVSGSIMVDQSSLNGESAEVEKRKGERIKQKEFWDKSSMFRGSVVCSGEGVMEVCCVGDKTVYGKLTAEAAEEKGESPLSIKLKGVAESISRFGTISAVLIIIVSFLNNAFFANGLDPVMISGYFSDGAQVISDFISSLIVGIIVIVVAVPEGLPLMIAIVCSLNMKKMIKANVLVRRLIGIETAGEINILFTDKTGTITNGKLSVKKFIRGDGEEYDSFNHMEKEFSDFLGMSVVLNSSAMYSDKKIIGGNATEKALLEFVGERECKNIKVIKKVPFSSENKFSMAEINNGCTFVKGAPEKILPHCKKCIGDNGEKKELSHIENKIKIYSERAMRLIAIAVCDGKIKNNEIPDNLSLIGIAVIRDDIRKEAKIAIKEVMEAGIQVVMITGDKKETAVAIAKETGLLKDGERVITSDEMARLTDDEIKDILHEIRVVARAMPSDKSRLVRIAQSMKLVTGMTGDGVNDAPALKLSDVSFSMGGGTEAAAAASDIVILDDNFRSVRNAILYGRTIYKSIKKFIRYQLTINVAAVAVSMLGPIVGIEKPLNISQMIWANLMIDTLGAIAFGGEPALLRYMKEKPRKKEENIIDINMWSGIIVDGLYISSVSLLFFILPWIRDIFRYSETNIYFYTGYFTFFIMISIFNAFNARCDGVNLIENLSLNKPFMFVMGGIGVIQVFMTYYGGAMLRTAGLNIKEWVLVLTLAFSIFPVEYIRKILCQNIEKKTE